MRERHRRGFCFLTEKKNMLQAKAEIRKTLLAQRKAFSIDEREAAGRQIVSQICQFDLYAQAQTVALYMPILGEVDLRPLVVPDGRRYCFPKVVGNAMVFIEVDGLTGFELSSFGVPEPTSEIEVPVSEIELMLVPGLAFDRSGTRLGYGKGFYDRFVAANPGLSVCGICMHDFFVDELPAEEWDQRVGRVITECGIFKTETM